MNEYPKLLGLTFLGSYLGGYSLMRICNAYWPKFGVYPQVLYVLSAVLVGISLGIIVFQSSQNVVWMGRLLIAIAGAVATCVVLIYFPYILPYSGNEVEYQKLSKNAARVYQYALYFLPLLVGIILIIGSLTRLVRRH